MRRGGIMTKAKILSILTFCFLSMGYLILSAQIPYPFLDTRQDHDILAYWYNFPEAVVKMETGNVMAFHSSLHLYGKAPADKFRVKAEAYLQNGKKIFEKEFESETAEICNGFFKIRYPVDHSKTLPDRIAVSIDSAQGTRTKEIRCRHHRVYGKLIDFDGNPVKGFIIVGPDGFAGENMGIETAENGAFELVLPERTYNCLIPNTEAYGTTALEAWGWHIIVDSDQKLDFKIGTGEVYNLNAWANNGGGSTYFISFRPMVLAQAKHKRTFQVELNNMPFEISDLSPDLEVEDFRIAVNGVNAEIISLQKYYETMSPGMGLKSYIIQVKRTKAGAFGKQMITVEYDKVFEIDGQQVRATAMGCFQFYLNFNGFSKYF
jgi:hypothetical protein